MIMIDNYRAIYIYMYISHGITFVSNGFVSIFNL